MFGKIRFEIGMLRYKLDQRRMQKRFELMKPNLKRDQARRNLKLIKESSLMNFRIIADE
jgi:hypothetical protein